VKKILIIAYNFPPVLGSSGVQRTLSLVKYLPNNKWQPIVLTLNKKAYPLIGNDQLEDFDSDVIIKRTFSLDAARHISLMGRYPYVMGLPDRWSTWWLSAVPVGLYLIYKYKPDLIYSTYPIATAHLIALTLKKITGVKWIADFRDPMYENDYPPDKIRRNVLKRIEKSVINNCDKAVFTTNGSLNEYKQRYPSMSSSQSMLLHNGYNEDDFIIAEKNLNNINTSQNELKKPLVFLHSGIVYTNERNPREFFRALGELLSEGKINSSFVKIIFRGSRNEKYCVELAEKYGIESLIFVEPLISYTKALQEMMSVDALLILQGSDCNNQVPAKLYEYLRAKKPILALTDINSDTASTLGEAGLNWIAKLESKDEIKIIFFRFYESLRCGKAHGASKESLVKYNRETSVKKLTAEMNKLISV